MSKRQRTGGSSSCSSSSSSSFAKKAKAKARKRGYTEPPWSRPPSDKFVLLVFRNKELIEEVDIGMASFYTLGRSGSLCDIKVFHESISRQHAVLQHGRGPPKNLEREDPLPVHLIDLGSSYGTKLNNELIEKQSYLALCVGDVIEFGIYSNKYVIADPQHYDSLIAAAGAYQPPRERKIVSSIVSSVPVVKPTDVNTKPVIFKSIGNFVDLTSSSAEDVMNLNPYDIIGERTVNQERDEVDSSSSSEDEIERSRVHRNKKGMSERVEFVESGCVQDSINMEQSELQNCERNMGSKTQNQVEHRMRYFARWQKHTKGFGLKILEKYGYVFGKGLGTDVRKGIVHPIIPVICSPGASLDHLHGDLSSAKGRRAVARAKEIRRKMVTGEKSDPVAEEEHKQLVRIVEGNAETARRASVRVTDMKVFNALNSHCTKALHFTDATSEETEEQFLRKARIEALGWENNRNIQDLRRRLMRVRMELETCRQRLQVLSGQTREFERTDGTQRQFQEHVKMAKTDQLLQARQMYRYYMHQERVLACQIEIVDAKNIRKRKLKKIF